MEKSKFECVSKKWQRCIYKAENCLSIGLNDISLPISTTLASNYPRLIPQLEKNYRLIKRLDINLSISNSYALPFINKFKELKELGISGEFQMKILIDVFQHLPYCIQYYNFKNQFEVNNFHDFLRFSYNYSDKTKRIKLCFDESINKQCIEHMVNYNKLQILKIESRVSLKNAKFLLEALKEVKDIQFFNIQANDIRSILENSVKHSTLHQISLAVRPDYLGSEYKIKVDLIRHVRLSLFKMVKRGHFGVINTYVGMTNILFAKKLRLILISYEVNITSLLKSKLFQDIDHILLYSTSYSMSGVYEMVKKNNIKTLCIEEEKITQELINIFIVKASVFSNINYRISIVSVSEPNKCYDICKNFKIYLNSRFIVENKIL